MAIRSGLIALSTAVRGYFAANGITANVTATGWRQHAQRINQGPGGANRVCFIPGDKNGRGGELVPPRNIGSNPRALVQLNKLVTVSVWACDAPNKDDEEKQIEAVETLLEQTIQAMHNAVDESTGQSVGLANISWGELEWVVDNKDGGFGREVLVTFTHRGPLYDATLDTVAPALVLTREFKVP